MDLTKKYGNSGRTVILRVFVAKNCTRSVEYWDAQGLYKCSSCDKDLTTPTQRHVCEQKIYVRNFYGLMLETDTARLYRNAQH